MEAVSQTIGPNAAGDTGRSFLRSYVHNVGSSELNHATLLSNLAPLKLITWRDVFEVTDAAVAHLSVGARHSRSSAIVRTEVFTVLKRCAPPGTNLGSSSTILGKAIEKKHSSFWTRNGTERLNS